MKNNQQEQIQEFDRIPISNVILIVFFGIFLHSVDVYSDIAFTVKLYINGNANYSYATMGPILAGFVCLLPHWWRIEDTREKKLKTLPLLVLQCWPQYLACRILYFGLVKKIALWRTEKQRLNRDISSIGE